MTRLAIIGGSGLYDFPNLCNRKEHPVETPFGFPSGPVVSGSVGDVELLFLARHGARHRYLPHEINYQANIFALKKLGARWCLSVSAVGSLREEMRPGDMVVPDQIIDNTKNRRSTFFGDGLCAHVSLAEPYCPVFRDAVLHATERAILGEGKVHPSATYLVMEGPAFSTKAESQLYRSWGADIIGMTGQPEAKLAREASLAYATLAIVTDYDCWRDHGKDVDVADILAILSKMGSVTERVLLELIPTLSALNPSTLAEDALRDALITRPDAIPADLRKKLQPILGAYVGL